MKQTVKKPIDLVVIPAVEMALKAFELNRGLTPENIKAIRPDILRQAILAIGHTSKSLEEARVTLAGYIEPDQQNAIEL